MLHDVRLGDEATGKILIGIDKAADVIKTTMGPLGRYVSIDYGTFDWPLTTNDGVTVANNVFLKDKFENLGAKYVRQAAQKTNDIAGDGTTTASILVQAIVREGTKQLVAGISPIILRRQIEPAVKLALANIKSQTKIIKQDDIDSLSSVATISCRDEKLGRIIAELIADIGADGVVSISDSPYAETEIERTEGLKARGGLVSTYFVNHRAFQQAVYEDVPIIVTDYAITTHDEVAILMERLVQSGKKKAVLIAAQIEGQAMQTIIEARVKKIFDLLPLRVIAYGPIGEGYMRDICATTGSTFITDKDGRKITDFTAPEAGNVQKIIAGAHEITFIGGSGDAKARVTELKAQLKNVKALEEESLVERIAKLQSKTATIKVGGVIDAEREERKKLVEDAVNATKAALSEGIITGGGAALYRAGEALKSEDHGTRVVKEACKYPLRQIALNSAVDLDRGDLEQLIKNPDMTIDFRKGDLVNGFESGIIDPVKVVGTALHTAASSAIRFLQLGAAIVTLQDEGEDL